MNTNKNITNNKRMNHTNNNTYRIYNEYEHTCLDISKLSIL